MSDSFDPYLKWLGIRNHGSGINHYRLLGLELFESDVDAISSAAERQMRHVESFAVGEHEQIGKKIISELRSARNCLLDPEKRAAYDRTLHQETDSAETVAKIVVREEPPEEAFSFQFGPESTTSNAPVIRNRSRRRKKNPGFDVAGWLLGAIGAVAFAYVLLNTDLIEQIKGNSSAQPNVELDVPLEPANKSVSKNIPRNPADKKTPRVARNFSKTPTKSKKNSNRTSGNGKVSNSVSTKNTELPKGPSKSLHVIKSPKKFAVPEKEKIEEAISELKESYKNQFSDKSAKGKTELAALLIESAAEEKRPEYVWALAKTSMSLSADVGRLESVIDAADLVKRRFDSDYWENILSEASRSLSNVVDFELVSVAVGDLLSESREAKEFEFGRKLADSAARVAKKIGDKKQAEMLVSFSQDLNSLINLKQQYENLKKQNLQSMTKSNHLLMGRYFCYVLKDWNKGLKHVIKGTDSAFASVAKTDLNAKSIDKNLVVNEWLTLALKPKYKGLDRRCMLERVQNKLSNASLSGSEKKQVRQKVLEHIQVIKKFVVDPAARTRTVNFGTIRIGNQPLGPIFFERASTLAIGPQKKIKISARKLGDGYFAEYGAAGLQFKIRFMDNGWVEMRVKGKRSNFYTIWYGK